jgi:hypothetical protein
LFGGKKYKNNSKRYYLVYETQAYVTPSFNITESGLLSEDSVSGSILVYMDVFVLLLTTADLIR